MRSSASWKGYLNGYPVDSILSRSLKQAEDAGLGLDPQVPAGDSSLPVHVFFFGQVPVPGNDPVFGIQKPPGHVHAHVATSADG